MSDAKRLRKWETYAYQLAFYVTRDEHQAAEIAGKALLAAAPRLAGAMPEYRAKAVVKREVLHQIVPFICGCLTKKEHAGV